MKKTTSVLAGLSAVAIAGVIASPAFAQSANINANITFDNTISVDITKSLTVTKTMVYEGEIDIDGTVNVSEAALSVVDNKQTVNNNSVEFTTDLTIDNLPTLGGDVLSLASGNIGLNVSAGDNIAQDNAAAISAVGDNAVAGSSEAEIFAYQEVFNNNVNLNNQDVDFDNDVQLGANVLSAATGNIGANVAAGTNHAQKNALAIASVTGEATLSEATAAIVQQAFGNSVIHSDTDNTVLLGDNVAANASGNIGLNVTAGTSNIQNNSLAVSSVN